MARVFTKNTSNDLRVGVNAYGPLINGASALSVSLWARVASLDATANGNRFVNILIANGSASVMLGTDASSHFRVGGRSRSADSFQTKDTTSTIPITGSWVHLGAVYTYSPATITPYIFGVAEGGGSVTFGSATYTNATPTLGIDTFGSNYQNGTNVGTTNQLDGAIAEVAFWTADIGAANMRRLAGANSGPRGGADPRFIAPKLISYFELQGTYSPENDPISGFKGTITGSIPPTYGWKRLIGRRAA